MTSVVEQTSGPIAELSAQEAAAVVGRLRDTFATGRTRTYEWRKRQLEGIVALLKEREEEIAASLASDLGRTSHEAWFGDIASTMGEAEYAIKHLKKWMKPTRTS